ncbi:MAG: hypothetical protein AAGA56_20925 [Myxococcota bacterium]
MVETTGGGIAVDPLSEELLQVHLTRLRMLTPSPAKAISRLARVRRAHMSSRSAGVRRVKSWK